MKKIVYIIAISLGITLMGTSCKEPNAQKDTKNAIDKLQYFNKTFKEYYADGVISEKEYEELRDIASEYYEMMNKINTNITEEQEEVEKGKKESHEYATKYKESLSSSDARIREQTAQFEKNLKVLATVKK